MTPVPTPADRNLPTELAPQTSRFYRRALEVLEDAGVPVLVGGAYAFACYTGIVRHTKDFDLFLRRDDRERALEALGRAGIHAGVVFTHWLAKAWQGDDFVDLIYGSGNAVCPVDDAWFAHSPEGNVLGRAVRLVPAEEMIWQKMFIMERERFDGGDVNHLFLCRGRLLDWNRLLARVDADWRVLLAHLILFDYIYPDDHEAIPAGVRGTLLARVASERGRMPVQDPPCCHGTKLSRIQYALDVETRGYKDMRIDPDGAMTVEEATRWTDAGR